MKKAVNFFFHFWVRPPPNFFQSWPPPPYSLFSLFHSDPLFTFFHFFKNSETPSHKFDFFGFVYWVHEICYFLRQNKTFTWNHPASTTLQHVRTGFSEILDIYSYKNWPLTFKINVFWNFTKIRSVNPLPTGGDFEDFRDNSRKFFIGRMERSINVVSLLKRVFEDLFGNWF